MRRSLSISAVVLLVMLLSACATGPKFTEVSPDLAAKNPDMGRIFFYRTMVAGFLLNPNVFLNSEMVGEAKAQGFFFVDRPAGNYTASTQTEVERTVSFTLEKGQTRFIRFNVSIGFLVGHVYPELMEQADAMEEITDCKYIGPPL